MVFLANTNKYYPEGAITELGDALESAIHSGDPVFIILASTIISLPFVILASWVIYQHFKVMKVKDRSVIETHSATREEIVSVHKEKEAAIIDLFSQLKDVSYEVMLSMEHSTKALEKVFDRSDIHYKEMKIKLEKISERFETQIGNIEKNLKEYIRDRDNK